MKKSLIVGFSIILVVLTVFYTRSVTLPELYVKTAPKVVLVQPYMAPLMRMTLDLGKEKIEIQFRFPWRAKYSSGSGVFIRKDGVILTAAHLAKESSIFRIETFNGHVCNAVLIAKDVDLDLAMLKVVPEAQTSARVAKMGKERPSGWPVYAIGNPIGLRWIITNGIISGKVDENLVSNTVINPGSSGGGLFDAATGRLQGITVAMVGSARINAFTGQSISVDIKAVKEFVKKNLPLCG